MGCKLLYDVKYFIKSCGKVVNAVKYIESTVLYDGTPLNQAGSQKLG